MVQQNVGWSWQLWCFFCWRGSIIHRHHWTYTNARRLQSLLHPENRSIDIAVASIGSFILLFAFWSFLHDGSAIKTHDRIGACLGVDVQHHCFREGAFEVQNSVQTASIWRKGTHWPSDHSVCYFLKIIKFWPHIREPCVWFDSFVFWFIKD